MSSKNTIRIVVAIAIAMLVNLGCASRKYVRTSVDESEVRTDETIDFIKGQIEDDQIKLAQHEEQMAGISATAGDALERAIAAGHLAEGKFLFETVLSDDKVQFKLDSAELNDAAKQALTAFAAELRYRNENVFIEIQGHTDASGSANYNLELGEHRAESVRRHLNSEHGLTLHRMSVISYGETAPLADNSTRAGRSANRRVTLVVLK